MQNIANLKDKIITRKDIETQNLQVENICFKPKINVLEDKIIDLKIRNNNED